MLARSCPSARGLLECVTRWWAALASFDLRRIGCDISSAMDEWLVAWILCRRFASCIIRNLSLIQAPRSTADINMRGSVTLCRPTTIYDRPPGRPGVRPARAAVALCCFLPACWTASTSAPFDPFLSRVALISSLLIRRNTADRVPSGEGWEAGCPTPWGRDRGRRFMGGWPMQSSLDFVHCDALSERRILKSVNWFRADFTHFSHLTVTQRFA